MPQLRLLQRLASLDLEQEDNVNANRKMTVKSSIIEHLERLLNTRPGSVLIDADMGLVGDATQIIGSNVPDPQDMAKRMLAQVHKYEPRLKNCKTEIQMNEVNDVGIKFVITGNIIGNSADSDIAIVGRLLANGTLQFDPNS